MGKDPQKIYEVSVDDARRMITEEEVIIIDVRAAPDHHNENIDGAHHLSPENFEEFLNTTEKNKLLICYCYFGNSSLGVCAALQDHGFTRAYSLTGGYAAWKNAGT